MSFMTEVIKSPSLITSRQVMSTMYLNNNDFLEIGINSTSISIVQKERTE